MISHGSKIPLLKQNRSTVSNENTYFEICLRNTSRGVVISGLVNDFCLFCFWSRDQESCSNYGFLR